MLRALILAALLPLAPQPGQAPAAEAPMKTGRIEGRVFKLPPAPGMPGVTVNEVELFLVSSNKTPFQTATVQDGRFTFDRVPAGPVRLQPVLAVDNFDPLTLDGLKLSSQVFADKTTEVGLFGKGRPVTGKLDLPAGVKPESVRVHLTLQAPPFRAMRPPRTGGLNPLAVAYERAKMGRLLEGDVTVDARFRIEGVSEGVYRVGATVRDDPAAPRLWVRGKLETGYPDVEGNTTRVWAMPNGQSDIPLDLGTLRVERAPVP